MPRSTLTRNEAVWLLFGEDWDGDPMAPWRSGADVCQALAEHFGIGPSTYAEVWAAGQQNAFTAEELGEAFRRLRPYLNGHPEPMIDARRLRIANDTATDADRRAVAAEDHMIAVIRRVQP